MQHILLLITATYCILLAFGIILEKYLRMPWIFAALFFGIALSSSEFAKVVVNDPLFQFLSRLGMLFLLFMIGFNVEFERMKQLGGYVLRGSLLIILFEGCTVGGLLYFVFPKQVSNSLLVAFITALSFATVGEAILLPILSEFKIIKTTFGQLTLGIGTADDVIEVLTLTFLPFMPMFLAGRGTQEFPNPTLILINLFAVMLLTLAIIRLGGFIRPIITRSKLEFIRSVLILTVFFSFALLGMFVFEELEAVSVIFGGMAVRALLPKEGFHAVEKAVEFLGYAFLAPLFFLSIGINISLNSIIVNPLLVLVLFAVSAGSKLLASYLLFWRQLGTEYSLLLGLGLSVRFSTGLIIQSILLTAGIISISLYSALVATAVFTTPVVLWAYSWALSKGKPP